MMKKEMNWKTSDKFRTFECGDGKVRAQFFPFIVFEEVMEGKRTVRGILTMSSYYYEDISHWDKANLFRLLTQEHGYYIGSSGASDNQPAYSYTIRPGSIFTNTVYLPRDWHVTMYGKLLDEKIFHIVEIDEETLLSNCKESFGPLLRVYKLEFRIMAFGSPHDVMSNPNYEIIEHGIPLKGYLKKRIKEIRKIREFLPRRYILLSDEQALEFLYDPIGENIVAILTGRHEDEIREIRYWLVKDRNPAIYGTHMLAGNKDTFIYLWEREVTPKIYWTGGIVQKGSSWLFEEEQPLAYIRFDYDPFQVASFLASMEELRLGDILFLLDEPPFSFLKKVSWDELKSNEKITISEFENSYVVCHREHGCLTVNRALVPYRFQYAKEVID